MRGCLVWGDLEKAREWTFKGSWGVQGAVFTDSANSVFHGQDLVVVFARSLVTSLCMVEVHGEGRGQKVPSSVRLRPLSPQLHLISCHGSDVLPPSSWSLPHTVPGPSVTFSVAALVSKILIHENAFQNGSNAVTTRRE